MAYGLAALILVLLGAGGNPMWAADPQPAPLRERGGTDARSSSVPFAPQQHAWQQARAIAVKILSEDGAIGSGAILQRRGDTYWVATNQHVLLFASSDRYRVQTPDGQSYPAELVRAVQPDDLDLRILQFRSPEPHAVAQLARTEDIALGQTFYAAGFPFDADPARSGQFVCTVGTFQLYSDRAFGGGYRLGYDNVVRKGMSGGPILNAGGQLVGINGQHKYPIWGNPYEFADGSVAQGALRERMSQLSWGIPLDRIVRAFPQLREN